MLDADLYTALADLIARGVPCATATITAAHGSIPNGVGAKMVVGAAGELLAGTVGGGRIEHEVQAQAAEAIAAGEPRCVTAKLTEEDAGGIGMRCGGQVEVFIDVHRPSPRLLLLGGGHVNIALARLAGTLGFAMTVVDDRPEWANAANFPSCTIVVQDPAAAVADLQIDERCFAVIATPAGDGPVLAALAATDARYIGVVASRRKAITLVKQVSSQVDLEGLLPRLRAPVGLDLGGRSPEAIALSIVAEISAELNGVGGEPMTVSRERFTSLFEDKSQRS